MQRPVVFAFLLYIAVVSLERFFELLLSRAHVRQLVGRGAVEFGVEHFPIFIMLHAAFPLALAWEVLGGRAHPPHMWPLWLMAWLLAQGLRGWAIASLGTFWNVRVWVVPGVTPVARGPYRWLRHPNYLAVALEFVAGPMMFGAWRTALVFSVLDAIALAIRIPVEQRALAWAAARREEVTPASTP